MTPQPHDPVTARSQLGQRDRATGRANLAVMRSTAEAADRVEAPPGDRTLRPPGRLDGPVVILAALAVGLAAIGGDAIGHTPSPLHTLGAVRGELIGPVVLFFIAAVVVAERLWPAQRRPLLSRGQVHDAAYLVLYLTVVVAFIAVVGAGSTTAVHRLFPWLALAHFAALPGWLEVMLGVVVMDAFNWVTHVANHHIRAFWRVHAVHHSQEELSILTTFRAHPLVHVTALITTIPAVVLASNTSVSTVTISVYICLASLPHANVRWAFGPLGRVVVSPAYHRLHHALDGPNDVNFGIVFTVWDVLIGRAIFPRPTDPVVGTGLRGRPVPVEQDSSRGWASTLLEQLTEPFRSPSTYPSGD
jgi:sterol desaturase/sphingolipid hydroxylase (fatty acid hydroxylase superfamily)